MKVTYVIDKQPFSYKLEQTEDSYKLNTVLSNPKGDVINFGVEKPTSKFEGFTILNPKTLEMYKILDEIVLDNLEVKEVVVEGFKTTRYFNSILTDSYREPVTQNSSEAGVDENASLKYNEQGVLEEEIPTPSHIYPHDSIFLGPTGGMVYEIYNYDGSLYIDLDCRKFSDYNEWGRFYESYKKEGIYYLKYIKKNDEGEEYSLYVGIKAPNFLYEELKEWTKKDYEYSKQRNSLHEWYVYRALKVNIQESKKLIFGAGFSEQEVRDQIFLLENHQQELEDFDSSLRSDLVPNPVFNLPVTEDALVAYNLSTYALYAFLNRDLEHPSRNLGSYAGIPWFTQIWSRDELLSLRAFINLGEDQLVKDILMTYINMIDEETGLLPRLSTQGSFESADSCFILTKRIEDFLFELTENERVDQVLSLGEIEYMYNKLNVVFTRLIKNSWNYDRELLEVKPGDSWMDTLDISFPLDVQAQFLCFTSVMSILATLLKREDEARRFLDLEDMMRTKVANTYFKEGTLSNDPDNKVVTSNIYLAYYFYPNLLLREEWSEVFDNSLTELKTAWGGLSTLSKNDSSFEPNYTGENNQSYHRGDSWYWINNVAAIVLQDFDEKKYRDTISQIVRSSTRDILRMGTLGFGSELSSASKQRPEGCLAQLWSSAIYIEMIDKVFEKE